MNENLEPGISAEISFTVEDWHLASKVGSGLVSVFSTAMMIAGMEAAAVKAVQKYLDPGMTTVGVHVDVAHKAATPPGMTARFLATLEEISPNGKGFHFRVQAFDDAGLIGEGRHERVLVRHDSFERKALERRELASQKSAASGGESAGNG